MNQKSGYSPSYGCPPKYHYGCPPHYGYPHYQPGYDCSCEIPCAPKVEKECVKTVHCCFKMYRVCEYKMYKVCSSCKHEFEYEKYRGTCPKCGGTM